MVRDLLQLNSLEKRLFLVLSLVLLLVIGLYAFLVRQAVAQVVARKTLEQERADLATRISMLESQYMKEAQEITLEYAYGNGYVEIRPVFFISRTQNSLSYNNND